MKIGIYVRFFCTIEARLISKIMIVFAAIMPHPPESIPGIGREEDKKLIHKTLDSFKELREEFEKTDVDMIVIISPHAQMEPYSFAINSASRLVGNLSQFGSDETYEYANDIEIADRLAYACSLSLYDFPAHLYPISFGPPSRDFLTSCSFPTSTWRIRKPGSEARN